MSASWTGFHARIRKDAGGAHAGIQGETEGVREPVRRGMPLRSEEGAYRTQPDCSAFMAKRRTAVHALTVLEVGDWSREDLLRLVPGLRRLIGWADFAGGLRGFGFSEGSVRALASAAGEVPEPEPERPRVYAPEGRAVRVPARDLREQVLVVLRRHGPQSVAQIEGKLPAGSNTGIREALKAMRATHGVKALGVVPGTNRTIWGPPGWRGKATDRTDGTDTMGRRSA